MAEKTKESFRVIKFLLFTALFLLSSNLYANDLVAISLLHTPAKPDTIVTELANGFEPHQAFQGTNYILEPLHRVHGMSDYHAWHEDLATFDSLTKLYARAWGGWPSQNMASSQNTKDLHRLHYLDFLGMRTQGYSAYAYTVLDAKGVHVIGSFYIYPSHCDAQAQVFYWIVDKYRQSLEEVFHSEIQSWLKNIWGYSNFNFPGPDLSDYDRGTEYVKMENNICVRSNESFEIPAIDVTSRHSKGQDDISFSYLSTN